MRHGIRLMFSAVLVSLYCWTGAPAHEAAAVPVVAQDLQKLRVPGKVGAVLWTRRENHYSLQVVFRCCSQSVRLVDGRRPAPAATTQPPSAIVAADDRLRSEFFRTDPSLVPRVPEVQAWILKADGTHVVAGRRALNFPVNAAPALPNEVNYWLPLPEGHEAIAIALKIDDDYLVQRVDPFPRESPPGNSGAAR